MENWNGVPALCVHLVPRPQANNSPLNTDFKSLPMLVPMTSHKYVRRNKLSPGFEVTNQNLFLNSTRCLDLGDVSSEGSVMVDHSVHLQEEGCCEERGQSVYSDGVRNNCCQGLIECRPGDHDRHAARQCPPRNL
jgi:hypothetical protein